MTMKVMSSSLNIGGCRLVKAFLLEERMPLNVLSSYLIIDGCRLVKAFCYKIMSLKVVSIFPDYWWLPTGEGVLL